MNRHGVALAADSAVTVTGPYGVKIYNTVNKLFTLSKYHPVGIMVYSSAELMKVPVETVIKHFRERHLGSDEMKTLEEYAHRFKKFIEADQEMFPEDARREQFFDVAKVQINSIKNFIDAKMNRFFDSDEATSAEEAFRAIRAGVLLKVEEAVSQAEEIPGIDDDTRNRLRNELEQHTLPIFLNVLLNDELPLSAEETERVKAILPGLLLRTVAPRIDGCPALRSGETGFVISGFGQTEYFPCLQAFEFVYSYAGVVRYNKSANIKIGNGRTEPNAMIIPFAQKDMIQTFMNGRSPAMDGVIARSAAGYFDDQKREVENHRTKKQSAKDKQVVAIERMKAELLERMTKDLARWTAHEQVDPTMQTISVLPKEELAVIAEALVNLTIHKRKASPDAETVGPPTDVAVISKGDGFIWIKRKHYFRPELNQHFAHNYFRGD